MDRYSAGFAMQCLQHAGLIRNGTSPPTGVVNVRIANHESPGLPHDESQNAPTPAGSCLPFSLVSSRGVGGADG